MCELVASWNYMWKWCDVVWYVCCAGIVLLWNIVELWWWDVECITHCHCISHLITTTFYIASFHIKHHLWHYSKPHPIPRHTIIPHHIAHFISHQHLSQHTSNSISRIAPHFSHSMCHITPRFMYSRDTMHRTTTVSHHTTSVLHNIASHFTYSTDC